MANKNLSKKLKQARYNSGLSQKQVYEKFGIKQARFSAWENGISEPDVKTFLELCREYNIDDVYSFFATQILNTTNLNTILNSI